MKAVLTLYLTNVLKYSEDTATVIYHVFSMFAYFTPLMVKTLKNFRQQNEVFNQFFLGRHVGRFTSRKIPDHFLPVNCVCCWKRRAFIGCHSTY
jgi:hypothetical protein